jgi:16S rRNA processing protein RimM
LLLKFPELIMSYHNIGKIAGTHGLDGRVVLRHQLDGKNIWSKLGHIFIEIQRESYIPYFIEGQKVLNNEEVLLTLDEIDSMELAKSLSGKNVYLEEEVFSKLKPKAVTGDMIGFKVTDQTHGELGVVEDLFETPGQVLATVQHKGKELIIPLIDATIIGIDGARRTITVNLPEGLLDVYL